MLVPDVVIGMDYRMPMTTKTKVCTWCKKSKPEDEFPICRRRRGDSITEYRRGHCKPCGNADSARRRAARSGQWDGIDPRSVHPTGTKRCSSCRTEKPVAEFSIDRHNPDGMQRECKRCQVARWQVSAYGQSVPEGAVCGICGSDGLQDRQRLGIDHDHETGEVRGILCQKCNSAIGMLGDDLALLLAAVAYLERGLTDEVSRERGIGPECWSKMGG